MTFGLSKLTLEEEEAMSEEASEQVQEEASTATAAPIENEVLESVIGESLRRSDTVKKDELIQSLKELELNLRRNYPDPERITVPVSSRAVIHEDFRRKVAPIPEYVMFPRPALVKGRPLQVGDMEVPAILSLRDGTVVKPAQKFPIYVAAGPDGGPWKDSYGEYVVIDPQTGAIRQRVKRQVVAPKRSWLRVKWSLIKAWFKKFRFDFKIIKRV